MPSSSLKRTAPSKVVECSDDEQGDGIEVGLEMREQSRLSPSNADDTRCCVSVSLDDTVQTGPRDGDFANSPMIVNNTNYPIVVFLARGIFFNARVLHPKEALRLTRRQTGDFPYRVHAVIGDEDSLPKTADSLKNLAKISAVPVAFIGGCLATAVTAGTLAGPTMALAPLISGMVVKGVVIDTAALASGAFAAETTKKVAKVLLRDHKEKLMGKSKIFMPGERYLSVTGGLVDGPIEIDVVRRFEFSRMEIATIKVPETGPRGRKDSQQCAGSRTNETEPVVVP